MSDDKGGRERRPEEEQEQGDATGGRQGLPGKGFDAGTGYGGAGADSAYHGESSYGGQAGYGGSSTRGAYAGGSYGRPGDPDEPPRESPAAADDAAEVKPDLQDPDAAGA